ncbi:MAG: hypothetical protein JSU96_09810, partial [Acidobacteriota bacterium]
GEAFVAGAPDAGEVPGGRVSGKESVPDSNRQRECPLLGLPDSASSLTRLLRKSECPFVVRKREE